MAGRRDQLAIARGRLLGHAVVFAIGVDLFVAAVMIGVPKCLWSYLFTLLYIIQSTQHKSLSYRYMFRLNKSSSGVSKNHKTYYNMPVHIWDP